MAKMIDITPVVERMQKRIDDFVMKNPEKKDCESVQTINEFIHVLELEAEKQEKGDA